MIERILVIAQATLRELIRSKILFLFLFFALSVVILSSLYGAVSVGDQVKVIKDFGLFSISIASILFCVIAGGSLLFKELARKTIYNVLSKAVYRWEFLTGKFLGITAVGGILIFGMGVALIGYLSLFEGGHSTSLIQAFYYLFLEMMIVSAAVIFFSSIVVTPLLSGLFAFGLFLAGRSAQSILDFSAITGNSFPKIAYWIIPHLNLLYVSNDAVYGITQPLGNMVWSTIYVLGYVAILLILGSWAFERRHFN